MDNEFLRISHHEDGTLRGMCEVVNGRDYGAIGDGPTNDTAAIQTAITVAARQASPFKLVGPVTIPVGTNGLRVSGE